MGQLGVRSPSPPPCSVVTKGVPPSGRAEAPQGLLAPQAGGSRHKPIQQSQGPATGTLHALRWLLS